MTTSAVRLKQSDELAKLFEEKQSNSNLVLRDVWGKNPETQAKIQSQAIITKVISKIREADSLVCISSKVRISKDILQEIPKLAQRGVRVYLLLSSYEEQYQDFIANKAVVRIDPEVTGLMILVDPKEELESKSGCLFGYNILESEDIGIDYFSGFDGNQLKEAFHYFIWRFWNSPREYRGPVRSSEAAIRAPFDIYPLIEPENFFYNSNEQQYLNQKIQDTIQQASEQILISLADFNKYEGLSSLLNSKALQGVQIIIYTALHFDHTFLRELNTELNIGVYAVKNLNTFFVLADDRSGLYLSGSSVDSHEIGIALSPKDVQDLQVCLRSLNGHMWTFHSSIELEQVTVDEIILENFNGKAEPISIPSFEVIDYGEIEAENLRQYFAGSYRPVLKSNEILARNILHRWKLIPKVLDIKAKPDLLYEQWDKETAKIKNYVEKVLDYAKTVGQERKAFLSSIWGKFFNREDRSDVDRIIKELDTALLEMKGNIYDWGASSSLLSNIQKYVASLLEQQLDFQEKQEYYEKEENWKKEREQLVKEEKGFKSKLKVVQEKVDALLTEINATDPELQVELDDLQEKLKNEEETLFLMEADNEELILANRVEKSILEICDKLDNHIKKFNTVKKKQQKSYFASKIKPYLTEEMEKMGKLDVLESILANSKISDSKENMKFVMKELATHPELRIDINDDKKLILSQYQETLQRKEEVEKLITELKNQNGRGKEEQQKQLQEREKEQHSLESKLDSLKNKLEKHGEEFKYIQKKKDVKLPFSSSISIQLPEEELPKVGQLFRNGKGRQLAISKESEVPDGETEADRFQAELVLRI